MNDQPWDLPPGRKWLRDELIAPWWEIALVLAVMLGPFAWSSVLSAVQHGDVDLIPRIVNDHSFVQTLAIESGLLAALLFYLRWRGWRPADFQIQFRPIDWLIAPALAILAGLLNIGIVGLLNLLIACLSPHPQGMVAGLIASSHHTERIHLSISWASLILLSVVNAFLEEVTFVSYGFNQFAAKRGALFALLVMAFLRMLLHTYKGPLAMVGIGVFSLVYGAAYLKLRRLSPLIYGHAFTDLAAFSALKLMFGR